ncbi:MAG TPA: phosphatidate cytidylyltransferase [Steroidobacteraceae bacterium]
MSAIRTRVMTALALAAGMVAVVLLLPTFATVLVLVVGVLAGAWEWSAFLRADTKLARAAYVLVIAVLLEVAWRWVAEPAGLDLLMALAILWWCVALCWILFAPRRVAPWSAALAGVFALVPAWLALMHLRHMANGAQWMLFVFILVWVADMGAFFFGRRFGRLHLAPAVSPGKTWEGVLGGMFLSGIVAVCASFWFDVALGFFLPLCLTSVAFSIVGDLTESMLKRFAGIKDSGSVFPGHGGVMDRIDSVTGAAPVLLFGLTAYWVAP